ncbi:hypothetical protein [Marispirochaeta aestuarii]|uniref:hypothetical protein n=1 Tax=Marispirochaeta aestuarii TaxID=1963862 RepID=UPI00374A083F
MIRKQKNLQEILLDTNYGIQIIAVGFRIFPRSPIFLMREREHFIEELSGLSEADVIVIDTSAGVSHNVLDFIAAADEALIVTTPEPTRHHRCLWYYQDNRYGNRQHEPGAQADCQPGQVGY